MSFIFKSRAEQERFRRYTRQDYPTIVQSPARITKISALISQYSDISYTFYPTIFLYKIHHELMFTEPYFNYLYDYRDNIHQ